MSARKMHRPQTLEEENCKQKSSSNSVYNRTGPQSLYKLNTKATTTTFKTAGQMYRTVTKHCCTFPFPLVIMLDRFLTHV